MSADPREQLAALLRRAALSASVLFLLAFAFMAARRVPYAFELEWMEGGSLEQVRRILAGLPLYTRPTVEYVSFRYAPLYFYVAAAAAALFGPGFLALRLVSALATAGSLGVTFALVRRETGRRDVALLAAGVLAGGARVSGFWFDVARVDALQLFLLLLAAWCVRSGRSPLLAGAALALAFHVKQTAVIAALGWTAYLLWRKRERAAPLVSAFAALAIGGALLLDALSGGWYTRYVFRSQPLLWYRLPGFWIHLLPSALPLALLGAFFFLLRARDQGQRAFYAAFAALMLATSWYSWMVVGAYVNALLPALAALAVLFALAVHEARQAVAERASGEAGLAATVWAAAALQLAMLAFDPRPRLPTAQDAAAGDRLVRTIAAIPGEVLVPNHPYLAVRAGKPGHAHTMAIGEVLGFASQAPFARELRESWRRALCGQRFAAVVTARNHPFLAELDAAYREERALDELGGAFFTVTGGRTRPDTLYRPRPEGLTPAAASGACRPAAPAP